jgi:hypothetical protein
MASDVHFGDLHVWLNNLHFSRMLDFALEVGARTARSPEEQTFVANLKSHSETFWPGIHLDVACDFPTVTERKFWARCFQDVARWIFLRQVGVHTADFWQASAIHHAHALADVFIQAAREYDPSFYPESEDSRLQQEAYNSPVVSQSPAPAQSSDS